MTWHATRVCACAMPFMARRCELGGRMERVRAECGGEEGWEEGRGKTSGLARKWKKWKKAKRRWRQLQHKRNNLFPYFLVPLWSDRCFFYFPAVFFLHLFLNLVVIRFLLSIVLVWMALPGGSVYPHSRHSSVCVCVKRVRLVCVLSMLDLCGRMLKMCGTYNRLQIKLAAATLSWPFSLKTGPGVCMCVC